MILSNKTARIKKKRTILILVVLIFTTVLASCGNQGVQPENNADAETQLANPWTDWESLAEAEATVGFSFGLPETISSSYKAESFRTLNDELIEVTYHLRRILLVVGCTKGILGRFIV